MTRTWIIDYWDDDKDRWATIEQRADTLAAAEELARVRIGVKAEIKTITCKSLSGERP